MFSDGQKYFALFFIVAFTAVMIWSYRKDLKLHKIHYRHTALKVIIYGILTIVGFVLVRLALK